MMAKGKSENSITLEWKGHSASTKITRNIYNDNKVVDFQDWKRQISNAHISNLRTEFIYELESSQDFSISKKKQQNIKNRIIPIALY